MRCIIARPALIKGQFVLSHWHSDEKAIVTNCPQKRNWNADGGIVYHCPMRCIIRMIFYAIPTLR